MSLTKQFFDKRHIALLKFEDIGYINIDDFIKDHSVSLYNLYETGYLTERVISSTANVYDFHVSSKGRQFLKEIKEFELILIKPNCVDKLTLDFDRFTR